MSYHVVMTVVARQDVANLPGSISFLAQEASNPLVEPQCYTSLGHAQFLLSVKPG